MPIVEEVEDADRSVEEPKHTTVKMGAASRLEAFANDGGLQEALSAAEEEGAKAVQEESAAAGSGPSAQGGSAEDAGGDTTADGRNEGQEKEKELTEQEKAEQEAMLERARALKAEGNALFGSYDYDAAIRKYSEAIEAAPAGHKEQAVFYNNRATCYFKQGNYSLVIADCTAALRIDPDYSKCLLRRAQAYETEKKVCEAYDDFERILKLDPSNAMAAAGSKRLKQPAEAERERMKEEMMGKLKDLGNTVLGKFGLSLDNFKATQDPNTGGYSISFQQNP